MPRAKKKRPSPPVTPSTGYDHPYQWSPNCPECHVCGEAHALVPKPQGAA